MLYYPWINVLDPNSGRLTSVPPSGHVAGSWARNDRERGVWNAPANLALAAVIDLSSALSSDELSVLQSSRTNVVRATPNGILVPGAVTLARTSRYTDIGAVRLICALGRSVVRVTSWAAFEPSNAATWHRLRTDVETILQSHRQQGAFPGQSTEESFYVTCDEELNSSDVAATGKVRIEFGFVHTSTLGFIRMRVEQPSGNIQLFAD